MEVLGVKPINIYEVVVQFLEPAQALVTVLGTSEEDALNRLHKNLSNVEDLQIIEIKKVESSVNVIDGELVDVEASRTLN